MKLFRLIVHQKAFSGKSENKLSNINNKYLFVVIYVEEDLIISQRDFPQACKNDIIEIFHPSPQEEDGQTQQNEDEFPHLLLQVTSFKDDFVQPRTISIEQSIVSSFGLKIYKNVALRLVSPADVALDSVEMTFRDQYMGRSEMWRLKKSLVRLFWNPGVFIIQTEIC